VDDNSQYYTHEGLPFIDSAAALNGDELNVFVINRNWESANSLELDVSGFPGWSLAEHLELYSEDLDAANTWERPDAVKPRLNRESRLENGKVLAELKSLSWNVFRLKKTV
jgi:alpha-N-arabinofuranosidase